MVRKEVWLALLCLGLVLAACASPTPLPPVKETVPVPVTVVVPQTVVVPATSAAPAATTAAPTAAPTTAAPTTAPTAAAAKPLPPTAVLEIVPVAANAGRGNDKGDPNVMTATLTYITDTVVGPAKSNIALGDPGLTNHALNVPVHIRVASLDAKNPITKTTWVLTGPAGTKAAIKDPAAQATEFTPDLAGAYKVDVTAANAAGNAPLSSVTIHVGTYIGVTAGNCVQCHATETNEWAKTGHAKILTDEIDNTRTPSVPTHYSESCIRCHTTGYNLNADNGGFDDAQKKANYKFPTFAEINKGGNWAKMPAEVKNMANIQCEDCHGPAAEHVKNGANVMEATQDEGVCNVCHNGGGNHLKGTELKNAGHADAEAQAWTYPIGPNRTACVRCHSGDGYATFLKNPTNPAEWAYNKQTVVCSTCHDPHSEANAWQLRIVGKPVEIPFTAKDVGLSATCFECHNARNKPADAIKGSFPHYSSAAEFISDTGGVDYGKTIPNSPHGLIVGIAPIPNPAAANDPEAAKFLFSKAGDAKGNTPGACVACHMYPAITDDKDPNWRKVGGHSFNTVSPDGKFDYVAACKTCHPTIKDDFNIAAKADYDGNGKTEGVQDEVKGLLNNLWKELEAKGFKKVQGNPYATLPANVDDKLEQAWFNYRTVYGVMWGPETGDGNQGKAQAVHNFQRAVGLLQASYKDVTGKDVPGATIVVK